MTAQRTFIGETFEGKVTIDIKEYGAGADLIIEQVMPEDGANEGHRWTLDVPNHIDAEGMYETLLSMHTIEEDYIEALGFQYT